MEVKNQILYNISQLLNTLRVKELHIMYIFLLFSQVNIYAESPDSEVYRVRFYESVYDAAKAKKLLKDLAHDRNATVPLIQGYNAAVHMVMANHVINPYSKFKYFLDGKKMLEDAIEADPNNVELRFIRLSIQTNVPSFLGYKTDIVEDKNFVLNHCKYLDISKKSDRLLYGHIKEYFRVSKLLTESERKKLPDL